MKLQEIADDGMPELTHGQKFMFSMIKKAIPHGLKLRRVDDWKKTHRDIEVTGVETTMAMSGDPLLRVMVNADWERPASAKLNNQLINDDDIGDWTIKKQEDGTFLMLLKKYLKEDEDLPFVVKMLMRLKDEVKNMRVHYQSTVSTKPKLMYKFEIADAQLMGGRFLDITVQSPNPGDYREWKASLSFKDIDDKYTITSDTEFGQKIWILKPKEEVKESAEMPILVSMLKRTIADHFKKGGPPVKIFDSEYHTEPLKIHGYQLMPDGALSVSIALPTGNLQHLIFPKEMLDAGKLYFQKGSNGRLLIVSNEAD